MICHLKWIPWWGQQLQGARWACLTFGLPTCFSLMTSIWRHWNLTCLTVAGVCWSCPHCGVDGSDEVGCACPEGHRENWLMVWEAVGQKPFVQLAFKLTDSVFLVHIFLFAAWAPKHSKIKVHVLSWRCPCLLPLLAVVRCAMISGNMAQSCWIGTTVFWWHNEMPLASISASNFNLMVIAFSALRKLEDKLNHHRLEFRHFTLQIDVRSLHGSREMPAGYTFYICVADSTLPSKGTAHRANRNAEKVRVSTVSTLKILNINLMT